MSLSKMHDAAIRFFARHGGEHLHHDRERLIERCANHLADTYGMTLRNADCVARQAWGEREARNQHCYFDLSRSTSHMVILNDPHTGTWRMLTVADVLAILSAAPPTACAVAG